MELADALTGLPSLILLAFVLDVRFGDPVLTAGIPSGSLATC